jgi:hypothetical protein
MPTEEEKQQAREIAIPVLDAWMAGFNDMDLAAWKASMNYPHYRLASGNLNTWQDEDMDDAYIERVKTPLHNGGWHHSVWTRREIVHCSDIKIHVDTQFTRYRQDSSIIGAYDSLYVLTLIDGPWGVQMRSRFAR